ncbi:MULTISPECIES: DUF4752 family protein [Serratia]|uniref:DUF4752 family protein n=1 Tax=Serratia TaxID=613 RepID=UPI0027E4C465|nr:DUF4752 family protein [Serratia marcescens]MCW7560813.1 DUF4752 family protein [Serratia marcescens]MCW7565640.1 DUF4752 family protein [Serratia marcescens]MCW7570641.1 DUF4752 family protein [Serratia marcescens]MCW7575892.1 DUF4752 family protein [Serratia marcescens]MCW7580641.1 DUF4752 family protein [Serratia marcescens]
MKDTSFTDWMIIGLMAISYLFILSHAWKWLIQILANRFDRFLNRNSPKQLAINALCDAFELQKMKQGDRITAKTVNGLCIRISREPREEDRS